MSESSEAARRSVEESQNGAEHKVLVVDDEGISLHSLVSSLKPVGYEVLAVDGGQKAIDAMSDDVAVAVVDLSMPEVSGLDCLKHIRAEFPNTQVIIVSGAGQISDAVSAMKSGASEYITKPVDSEELRVYVAQAVERFKLSREASGLREVIASAAPAQGFAAETETSKAMVDRISRIALLDSNVLITGQSGTGKSTIARMIHQMGPRAEHPFVAVNCASLPRDLIESELFGHAKGAFTGAAKERPGRVEIADKGTLFLDEIGDLPIDLQPKLLTFLQDHTVQRIGCNQVRQVDVRVITATHQDLGELAEDGQFREDLYYRLQVLGIEVPALKDRPDDIRVLVSDVLGRITERRQCEPYRVSPPALERLCNYDWPGNIRELENTLERATAFCVDQQIEPQDIEFMSLRRQGANSSASGVNLSGRTLAEIEKQAIVDTLEACDGNKAECARRLGISEKSIYNKMKRHELPL